MATDRRLITKSIFPVKIINISGKVNNGDSLITEKTLQITTNEKDFTVMSNSSDSENASVILDFGKEYNGSLRILTYTTEGIDTPEIRICYGESVSEAVSSISCKGATNDHAIRDFNARLTQYSDMSFSESGFRFAKVELLSKNTKIRIKSIILESKQREVEYKGYFRCNNEVINRIYTTAAYTCHLCMQQYIWDGIKRDRLVWIGDMHPEMLTVRTVFGTDEIIPDSLRFMREQTPLPEWMNGMPTYSLWWLHIVYDWYLYSGDESFLKENKGYVLELIKIITGLVNPDGSDNLPGYFLDWPCNNKPQSISGSRALLALCLSSAGELCKLFNENDLYNTCVEKKKFLINTKLESYGAKQVTAIAALAGWLDLSYSGKVILENSAAGWSTFMSYYLLKVASEYNMSDAINALQKYYGAMLDMGATTFWEDFDLDWVENSTPIDAFPCDNKRDIHGDFGAFCYKGLRHSLCHGWSSAPTAFLIENVLGIKITKPGCTEITIEPDVGNLGFAEGCYPTPLGNVYVSCKKENDKLSVTYSAPREITITVKEKHKGVISYEFQRIG